MAGVQLTENFNSNEFRCHCCGRVGDDRNALQALANALQQLRNLIGKPIHINDGFRCYKHNLEVKGAKNSQHIWGRAADIHVDGMTPAQLAAYAEKITAFKLGGIGIYKTFVHVDVRQNGPARWDER